MATPREFRGSIAADAGRVYSRQESCECQAVKACPPREATMPIEFIGMIGVRPEGADGAAVHVIGGEIDPAWVRDFSRAHEQAGFDKVLVGYTATAAEGFIVASYAASHTQRLAYLIAHPPRLLPPTP